MKDEATIDSLVRVAIVDDSRSIRSWLRHILDGDPRMVVVGEAASATEARALVRRTPVDVMTLDVDMPEVTGIEFLARLMVHHPMPVVMVSALTEAGSEAAINAFALGAVDCIEKPRSALQPNIEEEIRTRVFDASQVVIQDHVPHADNIRPRMNSHSSENWYGDIVLLGASTGGVTALESLLNEIDGCPNPVIIAQHMPENFLKSFAQRLSERYTRRFKLATDGMKVEAGVGILVVGKMVSTRLIRRKDGSIDCVFGPPGEGTIYRPNIDDLFHSAAQAQLKGQAALLTGMGSDGAEGLLALRQSGFKTFAQNQESCVVYGMPKAAAEIGAAQAVMAPQDIGRSMAKWVTEKSNKLKKGIPV